MHNVRQYKLLNELRSKEQITIKDLAILLNASYRTIQNDLNELKIVLADNGAQIISRTGKGISLDIKEKQKFLKFLDIEEKNFSKSEDDTVSLTNEMIYELINTMNYVKVDDLADKFYVSRSKISIVLKELKVELENYKLQIVSKPSYGIKIDGEEVNIRKLLFDLYSYFYNYLVSKNNDFQKDELKEFVLNNLKENNYLIASNTFEALYQTLIIMINRVKNSHISQISDRKLSYLYELEEFEISKNLLQKLGVLLKQEFPLSEIAYISKFLSGNRKYDVNSLQRFEDSVQYDLDRLIQSILKSIKQKYHEDFRQDFELYMSLGLHMIPLISRIRFEFSINNPLLEEIKRNYPLPYDMAIEAALVLRKEFDIVLDENEISYFALHFNLALERKKQVIELKKVLIVCSSGGGLAKLLAFKVKHSFAKYISSIDTADIHELNDLEMEKYDYILTTIPLPYALNKPTLHISHMLDAQDIHELSTILSNDEFELGLLDIVAKDIFYTTIEGETKEEIIRDICRHIKETRNVQEDFCEQVIERERLFTTEIGNYLAFPHPLVQKTDDTFISVSILSKPVKWDKNLVQVILLGTTRKGDSSRLQKMYDEFAVFVSNKKNMIELIKNPTFEMLEQVIKKLN